jgi:hypothetical protein
MFTQVFGILPEVLVKHGRHVRLKPLPSSTSLRPSHLLKPFGTNPLISGPRLLKRATTIQRQPKRQRRHPKKTAFTAALRRD